MITEFKLFESEKNLKFPLEGEYFIEIDNDKNRVVYEFIYNIELKNNKYFSKNVSLIYNKLSKEFKIEAYNNMTYQLTNDKLLTPENFFNKNKDMCIKLYDKLLYRIKTYEKNNVTNRYIKLLETLDNIDELILYMDTQKYNL